MKFRLFSVFVSILVFMFALASFAAADAPIVEKIPGSLGPVLVDGDQALTGEGQFVAAADTKGKLLMTESFTPRSGLSRDLNGVDMEAVTENVFGFGRGLGTDSIIGADNRVRITPTTAYPWRAVAHLRISWPNGQTGGCSGAFVGPHTVLTAGHCLYQSGKGGWALNVVVTPGKDGATNPYGTVTVGRAGMRSVTGWTNGENWRYDYGALVLPTNLGNTVGWFGLAVIGNPNGVIANLSGYPGDKTYGTQWYASGTVTGHDDTTVRYTTDMASGHSGSGVYRLLNGQRHIFGVNTYHDSRNPAVENFGRRINQAAFNNYVAWIN